MAGRLTTIDMSTPETGLKTLWGPKEDNEKLMDGFARLSVLLKIISNSTNTEQMFAEVKKMCERMANGETVSDDLGILQGAVGKGTTRMAPMKRALEAEDRCHELLSNKCGKYGDITHVPDYLFSEGWMNPQPTPDRFVPSVPVVIPPRVRES